MVRLQVLSGKMAGTEWSARHFPFWIGRGASSDFQLQEPAVWDRHFEISLLPEGFQLVTTANAFVAINGEKTERAILKNGDLIEVGLLKIRFGLVTAKQSHLTLREVSTWIAIGLLCLGQIALIYWLIR